MITFLERGLGVAIAWSSIWAGRWLKAQLEAIDLDAENYDKYRTQLEDLNEKKRLEEETSKKKRDAEENENTLTGGAKKRKNKGKKNAKTHKHGDENEEHHVDLAEQDIEPFQRHAKYSWTQVYGLLIGAYVAAFSIVFGVVRTRQSPNVYSLVRVPPAFANGLNLKKAHTNFMRTSDEKSQEEIDHINHIFKMLKDGNAKFAYDNFGRFEEPDLTSLAMEELGFILTWCLAVYLLTSTHKSRNGALTMSLLVVFLVSSYDASIRLFHWYQFPSTFDTMPGMIYATPYEKSELMKAILLPGIIVLLIMYQTLSYLDPDILLQEWTTIVKVQQEELIEVVDSVIHSCKERQARSKTAGAKTVDDDDEDESAQPDIKEEKTLA